MSKSEGLELIIYFSVTNWLHISLITSLSLHKSQAYWNELALSLEFYPSSYVAAAKG